MTHDQIQELGKTILLGALGLHDKLGAQGEQELEENAYGDVAFHIDVAIEKYIVEELRKAGLPCIVQTEELGTINLGDSPKYYVVMDGLDGSNVYRQARGTGRYGTMLGIFASTDPTYDDYIFCGAMEHVVQKMYFAVKDQGAFVIENNQERPMQTNGAISIDDSHVIYIDEYYVTNISEFKDKMTDYPNHCLGCSLCHYSDVASGAAMLALECTRKDNQEIMIAYGMINEAGGVMMTIDGEDLGAKKYSEFGREDNVPVITAATQELADGLREYLKSR